MKSNEVGTTLKHPETINGNVKNLMRESFGNKHVLYSSILPLVACMESITDSMVGFETVSTKLEGHSSIMASCHTCSIGSTSSL
jgi:hypothetical protein